MSQFDGWEGAYLPFQYQSWEASEHVAVVAGQDAPALALGESPGSLKRKAEESQRKGAPKVVPRRT